MMYFLSFLLSWLCGMLSILVAAFFSYDQFSLIDITSFAVMTLAGFLLLFLVIYIVVLIILNKKIAGARQFMYLPLVFSLPANLPAYIFIWTKAGEYYGKGEAVLFTIGFFTAGVVFGLFHAWKNKMMLKSGKA